MKWYLLALKKYATFNGKATRKEYWMFVLFNMIFSIVAVLLDVVMGFGSGGPVFTLYSLALLVPGLAAAVRRLHDIGKSGWMVLVSLIPLIGGIWLLILLATKGVSEETSKGAISL